MKLVIQKNLPSVRNISSAAIIAVALLTSSQASAASQCKGLESASCSTNAACSWVQSYERKDGRTVNAFCRTKAKSAKSSSKEVGAKSQSSTASKTSG